MGRIIRLRRAKRGPNDRLRTPAVPGVDEQAVETADEPDAVTATSRGRSLPDLPSPASPTNIEHVAERETGSIEALNQDFAAIDANPGVAP